MQRKNLSTVDLTRIAILGALASILFMLEFPIFPAAPFYKLDFSNVPVILGAFAMGPVQGLLILLIKSLIGLTHTTSAGIGEMADFLMGAAFILPGAIMYRRNKSRKTAISGMLAGVVCIVIAGVLANYYILLPFYQKFLPYETLVVMGKDMFPFITDIWGFLLTVTALFNLIKGLALTVVTLLLYKPLSPLLHSKKR